MKFSPNNFQQLAGLVYRYNEANAYFLYMTYDENKNSKILAVMSVNNSNCIISAEQVEIKTDMVYLKIEVSGAVGQFLYSLDGVAYNKIGEKIDASILSDEYATPMGFTGAFVGMCCIDMQFNSKCAEFYEMTYVAKNEFSPKFMREEG